ncbi:MAG: nitroreductase family protein [Rickettsiales bacterium]|jgi:nitroreductase|nr:nitroreductase family protein [Rickettsiales bacterium]
MKIKIIIALAVSVAAGFYLGFFMGRSASGPSEAGMLKIMDSRMAVRDFSARPIDDNTMAEIMWSAFGKNSRGTRTIPTSKNEQNLKVYAIRANGAFLYDGEKLNRVSDKDLRPLFARQSFVLTAPLSLVFVGSDRRNSPMHAGSSYQNVALYCTARGLGNVVRAYFDAPAVEQALGLAAGEFAIVSQTIGWRK